jgi:hypothetical protein
MNSMEPAAGPAASATRWLDLVCLLLVNAVPLYGILFLGWSGVVVIALYWAENGIGAIFTGLRIALHRRFTHKRGHWRGGQLDNDDGHKPGTLLGDYVKSAILSTVLQGIFIALFVVLAVFVLKDQHGDWDVQRIFSFKQLIQGVVSVMVAMALGFAVDIGTIRQRSFAWLKLRVQQKQERVILLHFSIILGFFVMIPTHAPLAVAYMLIAINTAACVYHWRIDAKVESMPLETWLTEQVEASNRRSGASKISAGQQRGIQGVLRAAQEDEQTAPA